MNEHARQQPSQRSSTGGLSKARIDRMHSSMRRHVESGALPGLVTLVGRRGFEHVDAIGTTSFGGKAPMQRDTIFRIASMTKPVTAVAAMILVEECRLRLDDPVDAWLPELANRKVVRSLEGPLDDTVPAKRAITLRDLLTFRCGYGEVFFAAPMCPLHRAMIQAALPLAAWPFAGSADELMKRLGALPLAHQPGERWLYHMSAEILGVLVARVSGKSLGTFLRERVLEPLGMKDTGFQLPEAKLDRLATLYATDLTTGKIDVLPETPGQWARPPAFEHGAGGLVSTVDDLHAFGRMLLNMGSYGRERILSRPSVELMTADHITPEQKAASPFFPGYWDTRGFGFGLGVVTRPGELGSIRRFGWEGAFGTSFFVDPREQMVAVLMTQCRPAVPALPPAVFDFWTSTYQLIDD